MLTEPLAGHPLSPSSITVAPNSTCAEYRKEESMSQNGARGKGHWDRGLVDRMFSGHMPYPLRTYNTAEQCHSPIQHPDTWHTLAHSGRMRSYGAQLAALERRERENIIQDACFLRGRRRTLLDCEKNASRWVTLRALMSDRTRSQMEPPYWR